VEKAWWRSKGVIGGLVLLAGGLLLNEFTFGRIPWEQAMLVIGMGVSAIGIRTAIPGGAS